MPVWSELRCKSKHADGKQPENTYIEQLVSLPQLAAHRTEVISDAAQIYIECFHPSCHQFKNKLARK